MRLCELGSRCATRSAACSTGTTTGELSRTKRILVNPSSETVMASEELPTLYRYLRNREHALDFAKGRIWLPSLRDIREYAGDPEDGTASYRIDFVGEGGTSVKVANRNMYAMGVPISLGPNVADIAVYTGDGPGYALCMSHLGNDPFLLREFGPHCIQITEPDTVLFALHQLVEAKHGWASGDCRRQAYSGRKFSNNDVVPVAGFTSTPDFEREQEYRARWDLMPGENAVSQLFALDGVQHLLKIVSP